MLQVPPGELEGDACIEAPELGYCLGFRACGDFRVSA